MRREVVVLEFGKPASLAAIQLLGFAEVAKVLVVRPDFDRSLRVEEAGLVTIISVRVPVSVGMGTCGHKGHTCIRGNIRGNGYHGYWYPQVQVPVQT